MRRLDLLSSIVRFLLCITVLWTMPNAARAQEEPYMKSFRLRQASAEEVAKTLEVLMPDVVVNADPRTNGVLVVGTEEVLAQVEEFLRALDGDPEPQLIRVFPLSHRPPTDAAALLSEILKDDPRVGTVNIVPDERANALVVRATDEESDYIQDLLRAIDSQLPPTVDVKVFTLQHADADVVGAAIHDLLGNNAVVAGAASGAPLRVAVDERTNSVIVTGEPNALSVIEAILIRLDEPEEPPAAELGELWIRVLWIVSGDDWTGVEGPPRLAAVPDDLADVAAELGSLGISNPMIATQMVVNSSGRFNISGSAWLGNSIQVEVSGAILPVREAGRSSRRALEISIDAEEQVNSPRASSSRTLCELETTLKAPLGHFIVLGVSQIDSRSSAFVVQVSEPVH